LVFISHGYHESPRGELFFETQCSYNIDGNVHYTKCLATVMDSNYAVIAQMNVHVCMYRRVILIFHHVQYLCMITVIDRSVHLFKRRHLLGLGLCTLFVSGI